MFSPLGADLLRHQIPHTEQLLVLLHTMRKCNLDNIEGEASMTKEDALKLIKLLSAMESWSFSVKSDLPVYLHEDLCLAVEKLEKIVLEEQP
jgi:hypothetical protein